MADASEVPWKFDANLSLFHSQAVVTSGVCDPRGRLTASGAFWSPQLSEGGGWGWAGAETLLGALRGVGVCPPSLRRSITTTSREAQTGPEPKGRRPMPREGSAGAPPAQAASILAAGLLSGRRTGDCGVRACLEVSEATGAGGTWRTRGRARGRSPSLPLAAHLRRVRSWERGALSFALAWLFLSLSANIPHIPENLL